MRRSSGKLIMVALHDMWAAVVSLPLAVWLRVGGDELYRYEYTLLYCIPIFCCIASPLFIYFRLYRNVWKYSSLCDLRAICKAAFVSVLAFYLVMRCLHAVDVLPRSVPFIQFLCLTVLLGGPRFLRRSYYEFSISKHSARKVKDPILIAGDVEGAIPVIRALRHREEEALYHVVGVVDQWTNNIGRSVLGVPILGTFEQLAAILKNLSEQGQKPRRIVLTTRALGSRLWDLQKAATEAGVSVARLPKPTVFWTASRTDVLDLRPIAVEALLSRPEMKFEEEAIIHLIKGQSVLVTGAGGSIGSELCRQIARRAPAKLVMIDYSEYNLYTIDMEIGSSFKDVRRQPLLINIRHSDALCRVFSEWRPDLVFHAAALKHVPLVENNPIEGVQTNVIGTRNVAEAARRSGALAFVQASSDKAVNPTSVMGATKRLAEYYCQALDVVVSPVGGQQNHRGGTRFITVRFGNVLRSSGSVVPLFEKQLRQGGPLTVTHPNVTRYFMSMREASELVLRASARGLSDSKHRGTIYVLDMGRPHRILDIAERMIRSTGLEPYKDVPIEMIGLRPGEKLYEELFDDVEEPLHSDVAGILIARSKPVEISELETALEQLERACVSGDEREVVLALARYVPGYVPGCLRSDDDRLASLKTGSVMVMERAGTTEKGHRFSLLEERRA